MNSTVDKSLGSHIKFIEGLIKPSEQQIKLAQLGNRFLNGENLGPAEHRALTALLKAEKAKHRADAAAAKAVNAVRSSVNAERRARTKILIELGGLVAMAQLAEWDRGMLLGALLHVEGQSRRADWHEIAPRLKHKGDSFLKVREDERRRKSKFL